MNATVVPRLARSARVVSLVLLLALSLAFVCLILAPPPATAAHGDLLWRRIYTGPSGQGDTPTALALAPGGRAVYVVGSVGPGANLWPDLALAKYTAAGRRAWVRTYDGPAHKRDRGEALAVDARGNVFAGGSALVTATDDDFVVLKYSPAGRRLWKRTWGGSADLTDTLEALAVDARGNVYAAGWSDAGANEWDAVLVKWTASGKRAWVRTFDGAFHGYDAFHRVVVDNRRGRVYAGGSTEVATADHGWLLARYSLGGVQAWAETKSEPDMIGSGNTLAVARDGSIVQGGSGAAAHYTPSDAKVALWTDAGVVDSIRDCSGPDARYDGVVDMVLRRDGSIVGVGQTTSVEGEVDGYVTIVSGVGSAVAALPTSTPGLDDPWAAVACDAAGNIYVTGERPGATTGVDYVTAKYGPSLELLWSKKARLRTGDFDDRACDLAVRTGERAGVYVTGYGVRSPGEAAWFTVKYRP